jgi:transcriptional regulator with XRE-family HTH domain
MQNTLTLRDFIEQEMHRREMTMRQFADFVGISHATISRTLDPIKPTEPTIDVLVKLAKATGVSLSSLIALLRPDLDEIDIDPRARVLAERIASLPDAKREIAETYLLGILLKEDQ